MDWSAFFSALGGGGSVVLLGGFIARRFLIAFDQVVEKIGRHEIAIEGLRVRGEEIPRIWDDIRDQGRDLAELRATIARPNGRGH